MPAADGDARDVVCILGLPFDAITLQDAVQRVRDAIHARRRLFLSTPNLNFLIGSRSDAAFRRSVVDSDLSVADGMPLVWMSRLLGTPLPERVTGSDLFERLRNEPLPPGRSPIRVYFYGGPPGAAEAAARRLNAGSSAMVCVGYESPGFGSVEELSDAETIDRINARDADFLVVALGAVKGQAWIERNRGRLRVPVISHLGAVVNFEAGTVSRAPAWVRRAGLEWLWRIKEEPALWRRYGRDARALLGLARREAAAAPRLAARASSGPRRARRGGAAPQRRRRAALRRRRHPGCDAAGGRRRAAGVQRARRARLAGPRPGRALRADVRRAAASPRPAAGRPRQGTSARGPVAGGGATAALERPRIAAGAQRARAQSRSRGGPASFRRPSVI